MTAVEIGQARLCDLVGPTRPRHASDEPAASDRRVCNGVLWLRAKAQLRGRARASLLLAPLVDLASALGLAAIGARRSQTALPRFLAAAGVATGPVVPPCRCWRSPSARC